MKNLLAIIFFIFCTEIMLPDVSLAQKKFMGKPIVQYHNLWLDGHQGDLIGQDAMGLIYILKQTSPSQIHIFSGRNKSETIEAPLSREDGAIYIDPSGRIYVGGVDIGYYFPGPNGQYEYHSLSHFLTPNRNTFSPEQYVRKIFQYNGSIVFARNDAYYFFKDDTITVVSTGEFDGYSTLLYQGDLYNTSDSLGLCVFRNEDWEILPFGKFFKGMTIIDMLEYSPNKTLICTSDNGLFMLYNDKITPFASDVIELNKVKILCALSLSDGSIALGTRDNGVIVLDKSGALNYHLNEENVLKPLNPIMEIFQDSFGNIWIARHLGLFIIEWNIPYSRIDQTYGLEGYGTSANSIDGKIYLGTSLGLFVGQEKSPLAKLKKVEEVYGAVGCIWILDGDLIIGGDRGLYQLTDTGFKLISDIGGWWHSTDTKNPNIAILGGNEGIFRLEKSEGLWSITGKYETSVSVAPIVCLDEADQLWGVVPKDGVYSFLLTDEYQSIDLINHYDTTKGLPYKHSLGIRKLGNQVLVATLDGMYELDVESDSFKLSELWNDRFGIYGGGIWLPKVDPAGNYYYLNRGSPYPRRLKRNGWNQYINEPNVLTDIPIDKGNMSGISVLDNSNILFSYNEGFIHYDAASQDNNSRKINTLIRYVKLSRSDSVLFWGLFTHNDTVVNNQPSSHVPFIPYQENSLVIGYSTIEFNNYSQSYRYQLEGYDKSWSSWTSESEKEYMNLWEGDYTFKVEAQNVKGDLLPMQTYKFTILPPWYRSWYAYSVYSIGILGLFGGLFLIYRRRKLKQINRLQKKHLESEVQHKQTELATTAMHLIEKIDFIRSIKTRISQILKDEDKDVNRELKRIIREIDRNSLQEDVWDDFERHFDDVHTGFLQKLQKEYPMITPHELKLSAYLRMNLSSKEIANLMQITPRSVEVARYRLRKKLGLGSEENLASFMMNY